MSEKETIRKEAIRHRERIDAFSEDLDNISTLFFDKISPEQNKIVGLYWAKGREFDPAGILEELLKQDISCALPVIQKDNRVLSFARWDESIDLKRGPMGVMQPEVNDKTQWVEPDILIVPMLAFDRHGHRIGYGGGYYDATIHELRKKKDVIAVGVAYSQQAVLFNLPREPHDEKLDWIITTQEARHFGT